MLKLKSPSWVLGLSLACTTLVACATDSLQPARIKDSGLTREQAEQVLRVALKHQDYQLQRPGCSSTATCRTKTASRPIPGTTTSASATTTQGRGHRVLGPVLGQPEHGRYLGNQQLQAP
ncbi:hypothetical protein PBOI14_38840 [Pseudomonas sp. Boi14]|nr:hypothetical protein PBOI14_38840 [Pseudomonas sp. Boi14]